MTGYTYTRGVWTDGIDLPPFGDDEQTADYLERIGFHPAPHRFGSEALAQIDLYEGAYGGRSDFYAVVTPVGNHGYDVHVSDFPSVMQFIKDFGPAFAAHELQMQVAELNARFAKYFRAEHGHDADTSCKVCDPVGWAEQQDFQQRIRSAQKQASR